MKYIIKSEKMSVSLSCGCRSSLKICVNKGRQYTNPLADEIDRDCRFSVHGTAFGKGSASIHFSAYRHTPWLDVANCIGLGMKMAVGDPGMPVDISRIERDPKFVRR